VHTNIDTDIIVAEETYDGSKPKEIFDIIERFSLGRKRVHLFGSEENIRPGWVTIGKDITSIDHQFNKELYE
jgi:N6-adenosine-specific RNA methylase IME4